MRSLQVWVVAVYSCGAACASSHSPVASSQQVAQAPQRAVPPLQLRAPGDISFDFQWRQHVTARWPSGTHSFDAVLQKRADELVLVGLSPLGVPGFVFTLDAMGKLTVQNKTGQPLPFEPAYVVADVQRVFYPWLEPAAGDAPGEREGQRGDTHVRERYERGCLVERSFVRDTPQGVERVVVSYACDPASNARDAPHHVELQNELLGYGLTIETIEQIRL